MSSSKFNISHINIPIFFITLLVLGSVGLFSPDKPTISEIENRMLKTMPAFSMQKLFSGEFFKDYEVYFSDTFAFRESLVTVASSIKEWRGLPGQDGAVIIVHSAGTNETGGQDGKDTREGMGEGMGESMGEGVAEKITEGGKNAAQPDSSAIISNSEDEPDMEVDLEKIPDNHISTPKPAVDPAAEPTPREDLIDANLHNGGGKILILKDRGMEIYEFQEKECLRYVEVVNRFQKKLGDNVKVYSMLVPTQIEFISEKKYADLSDSQRDALDFVWSHMDERVIPVDVYDILKQNIDQYIYLRTDHHWTALGAYYGYTGFMNVRGEEPIPLSRYKKQSGEGWLGSIHRVTLNKVLEANSDTVEVFLPFIAHTYNITGKASRSSVLSLDNLSGKFKYGTFLQGTQPLAVIKTEVKNEEKIMIIKDSYAQALIPFFIPHYKEIHILDPRAYSNEDIVGYMEKRDIKELLFINYMQTLTQYIEYLDPLVKLVPSD